MIRQPPGSTLTDTLFPYTTLFRSRAGPGALAPGRGARRRVRPLPGLPPWLVGRLGRRPRCGRLAGDPVATPARRRHRSTALAPARRLAAPPRRQRHAAARRIAECERPPGDDDDRTEERRVGDTCGSTCTSRWSTYH